MAGDRTFRVEDFLEAIASQLDRTQDALRLKAVNRPLTYAIREFSLDLKVFVEMDDDGLVRFRSAGANEAGASSVQIGFTTITRPMIEENTISLALSRSPTLQEMGLQKDEQQRLERLGVRNAAQLQRLGSTTGATAVSRLAGIPAERLRQALQQGRPRLQRIDPTAAASPPGTSGAHGPVPVPVEPTTRPVIRVPGTTRRLRIGGDNLLSATDPPTVWLNGQPLEVSHADDDHLVVELPNPVAGTLAVDLGDGDTAVYDLHVLEDAAPSPSVGTLGWSRPAGDPWKPSP